MLDQTSLQCEQLSHAASVSQMLVGETAAPIDMTHALFTLEGCVWRASRARTASGRRVAGRRVWVPSSIWSLQALAGPTLYSRRACRERALLRLALLLDQAKSPTLTHFPGLLPDCVPCGCTLL